MKNVLIIVLSQAQLARLYRHLEAQRARIASGRPVTPVVTKHFDDLLSDVQDAKAGEPAAIINTSLLWQTIVSTQEGRDALAAA